MGRTEISSPKALSVPLGALELTQPTGASAELLSASRVEHDGLLELVTRSAAVMVGTPNAYLYLHLPEHDVLEARFCTGSFEGLEGYRLRPGEGVGGRVWQSGQTLSIEDYDTWEGRADGYPLNVVRASLGVPLRRGEHVVGVIGLGMNDPARRFSADDIDRMERFAALASITLEHAQLRAEAQTEVIERRCIERELLEANWAREQSEVQARTIIDTVDAVLWEAEASTGRNLYNSPQVERLLGYPVSDWLEHENFWIEHVHPEDRETASQAWVDALMERRGVRSEYRMIARDGRIVWFRDVSTFVTEPGQPDRFRGVMVASPRKNALRPRSRTIGWPTRT